MTAAVLLGALVARSLGSEPYLLHYSHASLLTAGCSDSFAVGSDDPELYHHF